MANTPAGDGGPAAGSDAVRDRPAGHGVWATVRRVATSESAHWGSLVHWITRRGATSRTDPGAFGYTGVINSALVAIIVVTAVEIPVVDYLLRRWPVPRFLALGLSLYGLLWMLALLASLRLHPHVVTDDDLKLRFGASFGVTVPREQIARVRSTKHSLQAGKDIQVEPGASGNRLHVAVAKQSNLEVELTEPLPVTLPNGREASVAQIYFYADEPDRLSAELRAGRPGDR